MSEQSEITGEFLRERYVFDNDGERVVIAEIKLPDGSQETIKGPAEERALTYGLSYRFWGRHVHHEKHGPQFHYTTFVTEEPLSEAAIITYLATQCKGIGSVTAAKIYAKFGSASISALINRTDEVQYNTRGLSRETAFAAAETLKKKTGKEKTTAELMALLHGYGFYRSTVNDATARWGAAAAKKIRKNPYHLLRLRGAGFLKVDQLYLDLKHPPGTLKRQTLCGIDAMRRDKSGNTWHSVNVFHDALLGKISGAKPELERAIELGGRSGLLKVHFERDGRRWLAEAEDAYHEEALSDCVARIATDPGRLWPRDLPVSEHQSEQSRIALSSRLGILAGRPGTGKTYTTARIIKSILEAGYGPGDISVVSPTGKAAQRLSQALSDAGVPIQARTIHSLLFAPREGSYLDCLFLFVDESSMLDTKLAAELFRVIGAETHVLLIGDIHQLPPVGSGAPLRDLIAAGIPTGQLIEIQRNSGMIVKACATIVEKRQFTCSEHEDVDAGENLVHEELNKEKTFDAASAIRKLAEKYDVDPLSGIQVIVPTNAQRKLLNKTLQQALNPRGQTCSRTPFRVGDKVVNLKNGDFEVESSTVAIDDIRENDFGKPSVRVANGEQGIVVALSAGKMTVRLESRDISVLVRWRAAKEGKAESGESDDESGAGCTWDLAYAISGHKSQGSEWPIVIVMCDQGGRVMNRQWIYTAISRAKKLCKTVGSCSGINSAMRADGAHRKTFLKELVIAEVEAIRTRQMLANLPAINWSEVLEVG